MLPTANTPLSQRHLNSADKGKDQQNLRWNSILLATQQQQPNTQVTNNILRTKGRVRSVYNPLMPKENFWYHKNRLSKDLYMEQTKEDDSFAKGMEDLNNFADDVFRSDMRAQRHKEQIQQQVQATMNAQIASLQQAQMQLVQ